MCPMGRALAAAALATLTACAGSTPPPATQPAAPGQTRVVQAATPPPGAAQRPTGVAVPESAPVMTAALSGTITSSAGKPLARARVTLSAAALTEPRVVITGQDGRYE